MLQGTAFEGLAVSGFCMWGSSGCCNGLVLGFLRGPCCIDLMSGFGGKTSPELQSKSRNGLRGVGFSWGVLWGCGTVGVHRALKLKV